MSFVNKLNNILHLVSNLGIKGNMPLYKQKSIVLFNQIIRVLLFFMISGSVGIYFLLNNNEISMIVLGMAGFIIIALILNFFSRINYAILIFSVVLPVYLLTITIYLKTQGNFNSALLYFMPRFLIMIFTLLSVVFAGFQNPFKAFLTSAVGIFCFLFYDLINNFFDVGFQKMEFIAWHYKVVTMGFSAIFVFILLMIIFLQRVNLQYEQIVIAQKKNIENQRDEIIAQRDTVTKQKEYIETIHLEVSQSINYATRIQKAILPDPEILKKYLTDHFVLFRPKDNVSGDFYWWALVENHLIITVADCTGHGVPGAFMSMLGTSFLREIVVKEYITSPAIILKRLRKEIIHALKQKGEYGEQKDGMDMALVSINHETLEMQFAGANNPCYVIANTQPVIAMAQPEAISTAQSDCFVTRNDYCQLIELKADKMPVGIHSNMQPFTNQEIKLKQGDCLYMMSDGYQDQFGGTKNKKFLSKNLKNLLSANSQKLMADQKQILETTITEWIGNGEQTDDITILGIKI